MVDLGTDYLGMRLKNPLVASAGPISQSLDGIKSLADAGVGAVVMYSLFEEQLRRKAEEQTLLAAQRKQSFAEASSFLPDLTGDAGDEIGGYLRLVEQAANTIEVPLIASLNGANPGSWVKLAREVADAGADGLELNIYFVPGNVELTGAQVEQRHLEIAAAVKAEVEIPVAVKLSPFLSSIGNMCVQFDELGVDGLVLFNRFLQPDIDIDRMAVRTGVTLSRADDARLPRTWIALLRDKVKASLAATSGVADTEDVIKYLLAGADVVMTTSALVRNGASYATRMLDGLESWLSSKGLALGRVRGLLAAPAESEGSDYERGGYVSALLQAKRTYGSLQ